MKTSALIKSNLVPLALFGLALLPLMLTLAGCSTQPAAKSAVYLPPLPPMPTAVARQSRLVQSFASVVVPQLKIVTLTTDTTNRVHVEVSTNLTNWNDLTNGVLPMTFTVSASRQFFRVVTTNFVGLAWNTSISTNVTGYKIYEGRASHNYLKMFDAGNVTNLVVPVFAGTNYFAATAYDADGLESDFSNETLWVCPQLILNLK